MRCPSLAASAVCILVLCAVSAVIAEPSFPANGTEFCYDSICTIPIDWDYPEYGCSQNYTTLRNTLCTSTYTSLWCMANRRISESLGTSYPGICGCPNSCSNSTGRGYCEQEEGTLYGQCKCNPGFTGADCSIVNEENLCNERGYPVQIGHHITCKCDRGFYLNDCSAAVGKLPPVLQTIVPATQYADDDYGNHHPVFNESTIAQIHLTMDPNILEFMLNPINQETKEYFPVDMWWYNGVVANEMREVGFRTKGGASRTFIKKSWKLNFDKFVEDQEWDDLKKLSLKSMEMDPSAIREKICEKIFYSMNAYVQRSSYAQLYINNQNMGMYIQLEDINNQFLKSRFGNKDGLLYKCTGTLEYLGADPSLYNTTYYEPETDAAAESYDLLRDFIAILNLTPQAEFEQEIQKIFDVDLFIRTLTAEVATGNWDGIWNANNYFLYYNYDVNKFQYFRQDLDLAFGSWDSYYNFTYKNVYTWGEGGRGHILIDRILSVSSFRQSYTDYLYALFDVYFNFDYDLTRTMDLITLQIAPGIRQDKWRFTDFAWTYHETLSQVGYDIVRMSPDYPDPLVYTTGLLNFMKQRRESALSQLDPPSSDYRKALRDHQEVVQF